MFDSVFGKSFSSGKCKTLLKLAMSRIKLLRNKRDIQLKQMKRELAQLIQTNQEASARIRVEHVYREQNIMAAYEIIELFCELIVVRLPIIESQRQCPIDLREAIASLIFAAPRCADLPEMQQIRNLFAAKYGKEFVAGAAELRPDCGVNRLIIEKLSVRAPSGEVKLKLMKELAAEQSVEWDPTASESELLKAPEDLLEGSSRFLAASEVPLQTSFKEINTKDSVAEQNGGEVIAESRPNMFKDPDVPLGVKQYIPFVLPVPGDTISQGSSQSPFPNVNIHSQKGSDDPSISEYIDANLKIEEITDGSGQSEHHQRLLRQGESFSSSSKHLDRQVSEREENFKESFSSSSKHLERQVSGRDENFKESFSSSSKHLERQVSERDENFKDVAAAARAAAESADRAVAAARAAASLAYGSNRKSDKSTSESSSDSDEDDFKKVRQSEERPMEKYFKIHGHSFNEQIDDEKPLFDAYVEDTGSGRAQQALKKKQQSWKEISSGEDQLESPVDMKYDDDFDQQQDSDPPHGDTSKPYSSNEKYLRQFQDDILKSQSIKMSSSESSRAVPHFNASAMSPYQRQQSNFETVESDESGSQPPQRPPPNVSGVDHIETVKPVRKLAYVHPKLPDYDDLAARYASLRSK